MNDNRHGVVHVSASINIRCLYDEVVEELDRLKASNTVDADQVAPSSSWFYKQFSPSSAARKSSLRLTGRFGVNCKVLQRNYRKSHVDEHFVNALLRYALHLAIMFRLYCTFGSIDDKNNIDVGGPTTPIAAIERGRRVLTVRAVSAMDHDAGSSSGMKLIPTVFMLRQPPKSIEDPILRGQVGGGGLNILPPSCHKGLDLVQCHS